jgi:hypothetical protein
LYFQSREWFDGAVSNYAVSLSGFLYYICTY